MEFSNNNKKVVFILSITSDIGTALAERYAKKGNRIVGTYRSTNKLNALEKIPNCHLFYCDLKNKSNIDRFVDDYKKLGLKWDTFISCSGTQKPIGKFLNCDFAEWDNSIHVNTIEQLHILHSLYPFRNKDKVSNVIFFAGGGTNNAIKNYSAYTASKIMLIKMCELIDSETADLNIFIVGPGWTKTKIHLETLNAKKEDVGESYDKTVKFMNEKEGTSVEDIFSCIEWLCEQGKDVSGGRNFSVVYDKWGNEKLAKVLRSNIDMYKLRRSGNEFKID